MPSSCSLHDIETHVKHICYKCDLKCTKEEMPEMEDLCEKCLFIPELVVTIGQELNISKTNTWR